MAELTGKIIQKLEIQSGMSKAGKAWQKQNIIIEDTTQQFPRKVCVTFFGTDRVANLEAYPVGKDVTINYDLESREFNGRWYTDVNGWRIADAQSPIAAPQMAQTPQNIAAPQMAQTPQAAPNPFVNSGVPIDNMETPF